MKKLLFITLAAIIVTGCDSMNRYEIGSIYSSDGKKGIIVKLDPDTKSGLIMSLEDKRSQWYSASPWAESLGEGWRLPNRQELLTIYKARKQLNIALSNIGMPIIDDPYWAKEEYGDYDALLVYPNGSTIAIDKYGYYFHVRAVCDIKF